ncbi:MAG: peptidase domain-containing ABC transporter, partial [Caulobacterales bacterium]|nr:peptidase domain-containing ABC transporter [Caulobacterales bacterium]
MSVLDLTFGRRRRLPIIRAVEATECGLACMAMIARYYGHDVDLNGLRQRFALSMSGATLKSLMQIAEPLGFAARALRIELDALSALRTPCILHWDLSHFVVLASASGNRVEIYDPALGVRTFTLEQVSQHFTGVALELALVGDFRPISARTPVKLTGLWSRIDGFWAAAGQVFGLSLALQLLALALPFQLQLVVDQGIYKSDADFLGALAIGFSGIILIHAAVEALRSWTLQVFSQSLAFQMVGNVVHHL